MLSIRKWALYKDISYQNYCNRKIYDLYNSKNLSGIHPIWIFACLEIYQLTHELKYKTFGLYLIENTHYKNLESNQLILYGAVCAKAYQICGNQKYIKLGENILISHQNKQSNYYVTDKNDISLCILISELYKATYNNLYLAKLVDFAEKISSNDNINKYRNDKFLFFILCMAITDVYGKTLDENYIIPILNCKYLNLILPKRLIVFSLRGIKDKNKAINIAQGKFCPFISIIIKTEIESSLSTDFLPFLKNYPVVSGKNTYYFVSLQNNIKNLMRVPTTSPHYCNENFILAKTQLKFKDVSNISFTSLNYDNIFTHDLFDVYDIL